MGTTYYQKTCSTPAKLVTFLNATAFTGIDGIIYAPQKGVVVFYHVTA